MIKYYLLIFCLIIMACNAEQKTVEVVDSTTVGASKIETNPKIDTLSKVFTMEGNFSAEGNEGKAFYHKSILQKIEITFYGETGKAFYTYQFKKDKIEVVQQRYQYATDFTQVKTDDDVKKIAEINYSTDLDGKVIGVSSKDADLDTFYELKKSVPFHLK